MSHQAGITRGQKISFFMGATLAMLGSLSVWETGGDLIPYWRYGLQLFPVFKDNGGLIVLLLGAIVLGLTFPEILVGAGGRWMNWWRAGTPFRSVVDSPRSIPHDRLITARPPSIWITACAVGLLVLAMYYHIDVLLQRIEADGVVGAAALGGGLRWVFFGSLLIFVPSLNILFWKWPIQVPTRVVHGAKTIPGGAFAARLGLLLAGAFISFLPPILVPYPPSAGQYILAVLIDYLGAAVVIIALAGLAQALHIRSNSPSKPQSHS